MNEFAGRGGFLERFRFFWARVNFEETFVDKVSSGMGKYACGGLYFGAIFCKEEVEVVTEVFVGEKFKVVEHVGSCVEWLVDISESSKFSDCLVDIIMFFETL